MGWSPWVFAGSAGHPPAAAGGGHPFRELRSGGSGRAAVELRHFRSLTGNSSSAATLITTPFGFDSTAAEVVAGVDLTAKQAIVTNGASGIGVETARALAGAGASVTLAVRRTGEGEKVAAEIRSSTGNGAVAVAALELTDYASIAAFVAAWDRPLDILDVTAAAVAAVDLGQACEIVWNDHLDRLKRRRAAENLPPTDDALARELEITLSVSTIIGGEDEVTQVQTGVLLGARVREATAEE